MMHKRQAAIFDLDGTLINSLSDIAASANSMLAKIGKPSIPDEKYRHLVGNGSKKLIERLLPDSNEKEIAAALACYKEIYQKNLVNKTSCYDGVLPMLATLKGCGLKLAVCSNKHQSAVEEIVRKLFPPGTFDAVAGEVAGTPKKPHPAGLNRLLATLDVDKDAAVYAGDSGVDIETGLNADVFTVGVLWGFRDISELIASGGSVFIAKPQALCEII